MDVSTPNLVAAANDAWDALTALIVAYAFSAVGAVLILVVGWMLAGLAERYSYAAMGRFRHVDETIKRFISKALRYLILILVGVTVLSQFGVQTTSIITALGAASLAIGLALQGTLQNIAAGLMLLFLRPFRVGEYIDAGSVAGTVIEIGLFATELRTFDGLYVMAPNSSLWGTPVKNYSRNTTRRTDIIVGISYDDNIPLARSILQELADDERVLSDPAAMIFVTELGASSVNLGLRYWSHSGDFETLRSYMHEQIKKRFDDAGISIPFPQQDVRYMPMQSGDGGKGDASKPPLILAGDQQD